MVTTLWPTFAPTTDTAIAPVAETPAPVAYRKSIAWDYARGDVRIGQDNQIVETDGYRAWIDWCVKCVTTQRGWYPIYSLRYGVDTEAVIRESLESVAIALLAEEISSAILADPRTLTIENFSFEHLGDQMRVSFDATPAIGPTSRIAVEITP